MQIMIKKESACHVLSSEVRQSISFFSISIRFQFPIKIYYMFTNHIRVEEYSLSCFDMYQSLFDCFFRCYGYHHHCFFLSSLFFVIKNRINTFMYINKRFFYKQTINNSYTETIKLSKLLFRCVYRLVQDFSKLLECYFDCYIHINTTFSRDFWGIKNHFFVVDIFPEGIMIGSALILFIFRIRRLIEQERRKIFSMI